MANSDHIFLIEDDKDIRGTFKLTLESCGHKVITVDNGWDAISLLAKIPAPSLIILDLSMPIMNGEEFLKLKEENAKLAGIPVLLVSSRSDRLDLLDKYPSLKKPVDLEEFASKVANCLKSPK